MTWDSIIAWLDAWISGDLSALTAAMAAGAPGRVLTFDPAGCESGLLSIAAWQAANMDVPDDFPMNVGLDDLGGFVVVNISASGVGLAQ